MKVRLSSDRIAVVASDLKWIPVDDSSPFGSKCFLINRAAGQPTVGVLQRGHFFDCWFPLPTFKKDDYVREKSNAGGADDPPVDGT